MKRGSGIVFVLVAQLACERWFSQHTREEAQITASLAGLSLISVRSNGLDSPSAALPRLVVSAERIALDNVEQVRSWSAAEQREATARTAVNAELWPMVRPELLQVRDGHVLNPGRSGLARYRLPLLFDALSLLYRFSSGRSPPTLSVWFASTTRVQLAMQVLFTAMEAGYQRFELVVQTPEGRRVLRYQLGDEHEQREYPSSLPPVLPRLQRSVSTRPHEENNVTFVLLLTRAGYSVEAPGGFLQLRCERVGSPTVVAPLGALEALTQCMIAARSVPEWRPYLNERNIIVRYDNDELPFAELLRAVVAVREQRAGAKDLFPVFDFSVLEASTQ